MSIKLHLLATVAVVAGAAWAGSAAADDQAAGQPPQAPSAKSTAAAQQAQVTAGVGEVIVTARRVEENIQRAPVAVTAVTPKQIEALHLHDLADLNHMAPNFTIQPAGALFRSSAIGFARGIGYNNIDGTLDPALGISVDGVFFQRNIGVLQNMFDLSGVEIVLGPQGTLYGKNTIAGVLNVTTQKPQLGDYEASGLLRFGNLGRIDSQVVGNIPLSETLAVRVAFQSQHSDGPYTNLAVDPATNVPNGIRVGGDNSWTVRASLLWTPSDRWEFTTIGTVLRNRSDSVGTTNESSAFSLAGLFLGRPGFGQPGGPTSPYIQYRTFPSADYFDLDSITQDIRYHANGFDVISITNYMVDNSPLNYDDFTGAGLLNNFAIVDHYQYSEDLRAQSNGRGPLHWVAGIYYDFAHYDYWQAFTNNIPVVFGLPASVQNQWIFQNARSLSGYGQVDYSITDKLQLTGGLRLLTETKDALNYTGFVHPVTRDLSLWPPENIVSGKKTWDAVTYHLGAKYQFTDDVMGYLSYSTGFLAGGFNSAAVAGTGIVPGLTQATLGPWAPETAGSYEMGVRSEWFEHRLQVNLTGFRTNYKNLQSFQSVGINPQTGLNAVGPLNTGDELARGVELQTIAVPIPGLRLSASVGYLDAKFTSFKTTTPIGASIDCTLQHTYQFLPGACVPQLSPNWTVHLDGSYDFHTDVGTFTPVLAYSYTSTYYLDNLNEPLGRVGSFGLFDAALNYEDPTGRWGASLWAHNLGDKRYILAFFDGNPIGLTGVQAQNFADPRTFGIELHVKLVQPK